jgi:non-specific serine/threonine protein kinase
LVGRADDVERVRGLLGRTRLLTLAGAGGVGKTRMALRVAERCAAEYADGVCWVELASLTDAGLVPYRIASALGVPQSPGRPVQPSLVEYLAGWHGLLVLDNCEHLVGACAAVVDEMLRRVPQLPILVTSREPLGVAGEVSWPVAPLPVPDPQQPSTAADLLRFPAVELFVERAVAAWPSFTLTDARGPDVARLCWRLDGIPLAIELAAARTRVLSLPALLDRLDDDLALLADRGRTAVPRHRTLLSTMDWSYDLLAPGEQRLFRQLSVFAGGFTLEAAGAVGTAGDPVLDLVSGLVEKSLIVVDRPDRYRMLQTIHRYAAARLDAAGETGCTRDAHAAYIGALAAAAETGLARADQRTWLDRLGAEHDNIAGALAWLSGQHNVQTGLDLAGRLGRFWWFAGHFAEGAAWLTTFLSLPAAHPRTRARARALHALGLATFWHETAAAGIHAARPRFEEAADIYRELGDDHALAAVLRDLGGYWKGVGDTATATAVLDESVAIAARIGDEYAAAAATAYLGITRVYIGDLDTARHLLERSYDVLHHHDVGDELVRCLFFLVCVDCDAGNAAAARTRFTELMALDPLAAPYTSGFALDGLSRLAVAEAQPHRALRLAGAARATHQRLGTSAGPAYDEYVRRGLQPARELLTERTAEQAYARGLKMPFAEAVADGMRTPTRAAATILTSRESEVLQLVADGLPDAEIARRLHLSRRTVGNHLSAAYRKLGVTSRTAALREAHHLGLLQTS